MSLLSAILALYRRSAEKTDANAHAASQKAPRSSLTEAELSTIRQAVIRSARRSFLKRVTRL